MKIMIKKMLNRIFHLMKICSVRAMRALFLRKNKSMLMYCLIFCANVLLHLFLKKLFFTKTVIPKNETIFAEYFPKTKFPCSSGIPLNENDDDSVFNDSYVSETYFESCFNESTIIDQKKLNFSTLINQSNLYIPEIPGFPYVSQLYQTKDHAAVFRSLSDWQYTTEVDSIKVDEVKCGDIIFVTQHFVNYFWEIYHLKIKSKYILISHESDYPAGYPWHQMYLNHDTIIHWFAQNVIAKHPKLEPIPIGIVPPRDDSFETLFDAVRNNIIPYFNRTTFLYLNFSLKTNKNRTGTIKYFKEALKKESFKAIVDEDRKSWKQYLIKIGNSQFVLSPPGNGIDCHRTWEALAMGAVPIVLKSELQPLYDDMPVMVVKDWTEVTKESMQAFQKNKLNRFDKDGVPVRPKLWLRYWVNYITKLKIKYMKDFC